jgi:hypothetical protein
MGAHYDSCNNSYGDIREQKYSILFDMKDHKCLWLEELQDTWLQENWTMNPSTKQKMDYSTTKKQKGLIAFYYLLFV